MTELTDKDLVAGALAGSADAYRELVQRYQRPIISLIQRMLGDPWEAEDVAQEVFVKAFGNLHRFEPERKLSSWLFKIAHNTTIDRMRRQRPATVPLKATSSDGGESWEVLQAPQEQAPDRRAQRAEVAEAITAGLGRLKPQYREVLLLRFQQGLAYREIAEVLGLRMGTVKIHLHRARKLLAAELAAAGFEPPQRFADDTGE
ncbi:MAG: sigma-70 family RNA polymerase sigma factor [Thermoanaerobaculia bacterium]